MHHADKSFGERPLSLFSGLLHSMNNRCLPRTLNLSHVIIRVLHTLNSSNSRKNRIEIDVESIHQLKEIPSKVIWNWHILTEWRDRA